MFSLRRALSATFPNDCKYRLDTGNEERPRGFVVGLNQRRSLVFFQGKTDSPLIIARERQTSEAHSPLGGVIMSNQIY